MPHLLSVNVTEPRPNPWKDTRLTSIDRRPVRGPVEVHPAGPKGDGEVGLAGDRVYDTANHGGTDQAVYAYAREDLDTWAAELDRELPDGVFGENLTTAGLDVNGALVGEEWQIGDTVVLEVTGPRIPCATFRGWMGIKGWLKRFTDSGLPGAYLRVATPGTIQAGDPVRVLARPAHEVTVALALRAFMGDRTALPALHKAEALPEEYQRLLC